jgi:hypothetical protein
MAQIKRKYPGKNETDIFHAVHEVMERIAVKMSLSYEKDEARRSGKVSKMGITGVYQVKGEEVVVEMKYPMLVPGSMREKVEEDIERRLDALFS